MKITLLIATVCCLSFFTQAQENETSQNHHEISVDVSPFIKRIISDHPLTNNITSSPYFFMYRSHFGRWAVRAGFGGLYNNSSSSYTEDNLQWSYQSTKSLDARVGVERKNNLNNRWQLYYALDIWASTMQNTTDYEFLESENNHTRINDTYRIGLAPVFGFRFSANEYISFGAETSYLVYAHKDNYSRIYIENTASSTSQEVRGISTNHYSLANIFINFHF